MTRVGPRVQTGLEEDPAIGLFSLLSFSSRTVRLVATVHPVPRATSRVGALSMSVWSRKMYQP